eukprot:gene18134-20651_t
MSIETDQTDQQLSPTEFRPAPQHWRIKLYELEEQGAWIDKGTGFVHVKVVSEFGGPALVIRSEENDGVIFFQSKVITDDVYEIQGDNIIMWREVHANGGMGLDYALSFQEATGCTAIWDQISSYQAMHRAQEQTQQLSQEEEEHTFATPSGAPSGLHERSSFAIGSVLSILDISRSPTSSSRSNSVCNSLGYNNSSVVQVLPAECDEDSLQRIRYKLETLYPAQKEFAVTQLLHHDGAYISKLFSVFNKLEAKNNIVSLKIMADIFRAILLLNEPSVLEHFLASDALFRNMCGCFEYDRTLREKGSYREFLFNTARYREVVPLETSITDPTQVTEMRTGITMLYRLRFVRDIMLHPKIDDPGITAIGSMISFSSSEICTSMLQNTVYMARILKVIWPALQIEDYLPHSTCSASSSVCSAPQSNANSLCASDSAHPTKPTSTSTTLHTTNGVAKHANTSIADTNAGIPETPTSPPRKHSIDSIDSVVTFEGDEAMEGGLSDQDDELIGPMPDEHHNNTHTDVANNNTGAMNVATSDDSPVSVETRPIDGLRFLRELFAMSKFLQPEKRAELFHQLFESLKEPLLLVINRVLVECRNGCTSTSTNNTSDTTQRRVPTDNNEDKVETSSTSSSPPSTSTSTENLFTASEKIVAKQVIGELLTALSLVCPSLLRQVVLNAPMPDVNPLGSTAKSTTGAAAPKLTNLTTTKPVAPKPDPWYEHCTLFLCIDVIINGTDAASIQSFGDVLKLILDLEKTPNSKVKNDNLKFLSAFYDHYLAWLLVPYLENLDPSESVPASFYTNLGVRPHRSCKREITTNSSNNDVAMDTVNTESIPHNTTHDNSQDASAIHASRRNLFEILVHCVSYHSYRFKYFAMRNSTVGKILTKNFAPGSQSWLHMLGIKFLKSVILSKDEFYYKHIEKLDLLKNALQMFKTIRLKDNMVTAQLLDVIEDIRSCNIKNLIVYIVSKYSDCFEGITWQGNVYEKLKIKYEQILDRHNDTSTSAYNNASNMHSTISNTNNRRKLRDFDSEEDYFFGEDDNSEYSDSNGSTTSKHYKTNTTDDVHSVHNRKVNKSNDSATASAIAHIVHGAFPTNDHSSLMFHYRGGNSNTSSVN